MADREKVLKGLECCCSMTGEACRQCPYDEECAEMIGSGSAHLCSDALELLKEQQKQRFFVDSDGKMTPLPIQERGHWISVKDNRPKDQKPVIVYVPPHTNKYGDEFIGYVGTAYYTYSVNGGYWCGTDGNVYGAIGAIATPSHWMPLPEPPEGVKQDD